MPSEEKRYFEVGGTELEVLCRGSTSRERRLNEGEALAIAELIVEMRGDKLGVPEA